MSDAAVEHVLTEGDMEVHGRIAGSSNATLLVTCRLGDEELLAVYKPHKGERPLWDFPGGLFRREVAAYVLSEHLGWGLVPETVERDEGPFGPGSVQRFVHEDGASHYFTLRDEPRWHPVLMRLCAFDVVANNADRKSGHVLLAEDRLWAIDNGLCFNTDDKLRTVIWDFGGAPLEAEVEEDLARLAHDGAPPALCELIEPAEVAATLDRAAWLLSLRSLPELVDDGGWPPYPWPLV
ncbi:MAG: SCO1664 family protein [Acidimicrobiales bacterium]